MRFAWASEPLKDDAVFNYQVEFIREAMARVEIVLQDNEIPGGVIDRCLKGLLYGWPNESDSHLRQEQMKKIVELGVHAPPDPYHPPGARAPRNW
jgi:hypothetical protein